MPKPFIRLMEGDNGHQIFFESYCGTILILRCHGDIYWSVFIDHIWINSSQSLRKALHIAWKHTPFKPIIDKEYHWCLPRLKGKMQLVRKGARSFSFLKSYQKGEYIECKS